VFSSFALPFLIVIFCAAAGAVWVAGIHLSNTSDVLSHRLHLGEALGGLLLLAFTTNLPEVAIVVSAAIAKQLGIAIGNILGGIAIQTVVLVVLDVFGLKKRASLTYMAATLSLVLEATLVIAVLIVAIMGSALPHSTVFLRLDPGAVLIFLLWLAGIYLLAKARSGLPWHESGEAPGNQPMPRGIAMKMKSDAASEKGISLARTVGVFAVASVITLIGGVVLEQSGEAIAVHIGITGVLFGATVLAAATSLPEVSTGLTSVRMEDYQLAMSDIFGGNAFLPVLFLVAGLISGQAVLPQINSTDLYLTGLGILLTTVYIYGLIFRPRHLLGRMGLDSVAVLVLYAVGLVGLVAVARAA
jgi:cation:H+ antiporter